MFGRAKKKQKMSTEGLVSLMEPTVTFMRGLHQLGGFGYILFGSGLSLVFYLVVMADSILGKVLSFLLPLSIVLLVVGIVFVVVRQVLEHRIVIRKLDMVITITIKMVERKLENQDHLDTAEMKKITKDVVKTVWGLSSFTQVSRRQKKGTNKKAV
jgi:hypothetical protein